MTTNEKHEWFVVRAYQKFGTWMEYGPFVSRDEAESWATDHAAKFRKLCIKPFLSAIALALVTIPTFAHPVYPPDEYLAGCTIAHDDDGSRYAECPEDGAVLVYDADGNRYVNESGAPIHGAGWYVQE